MNKSLLYRFPLEFKTNADCQKEYSRLMIVLTNILISNGLIVSNDCSSLSFLRMKGEVELIHKFKFAIPGGRGDRVLLTE